MWPTDESSLVAVQKRLATATPDAWLPGPGRLRVAGCWVCFGRDATGPGSAGDPAWAAVAVLEGQRVVEARVVRGTADAAYRPGLFALRVGRLLTRVTRTLTTPPAVLLVDGTGRDHPRRAGLALHLGAVLDLPTVGVTHRPLLAEGRWPEDRRGATSPLRLGDDVVACWLRTREGVRPVVAHPGWRVDLATAAEVVGRASAGRRTPEPLRHARHLAREARAGDG